MSGRIVGRRGKLMTQTEAKIVLFKALTPDPDLQKFASGNMFWVEEPPGYPEVRVDGIVSGGSVNPTANNNEVQVEAIVTQNAGAEVNAAADLSVTVTRPTTGGMVVVNAIVVDGAGAITNVPGTEGASGGARGAAGGPPFIPVGSLVVAEVVLGSTVAAKVLAGEINMDAAERADSPSYDIDFLDGKVVLTSPLPAIHTGSTVRKVYAQYKYALLVDVGDLFDWNMTETATLLDKTAFNEDWTSEAEGVRSWSGSFNGYWVNAEWFKKAAKVDGGTWFLKLFPDRRSSRHWVGRAHLDHSLSVSKDAMVTETITFKGIGPVAYKDA